MRKHLPWLVVVAALIGLWLAQDLVVLHYDLQFDPDKAAQSGCEQSDTLSCGAVNSSKWSELPLGEGRAPLPTAVPAVGFFVMSGLLAMLALFGSEERRKKALAVVAGFAAIGVLLGLWLIYIQAFALKAWCLFCLGVDAASLTILVVALLSHDGGVKGVLADLKELDWGLAGIAVVVILAVSGGSYGSYNGKVSAAGGLHKRSLVDGGGPTPAEDRGTEGQGGAGPVAHGPGDGHDHDAEQPKSLDEMTPEERVAAIAETRQQLMELYAAHMSQPKHEIEVNPFDLVKGNPDAKVVMVDFADFQCPYCGQVAFFMQDIAQRYYDHILFVYKHYPLGADCNEHMTRDMHPEACEAAVGVQCARRKGKGWLYHDHTYDSSSSLGTRKLMKMAEGIGLDREWFGECIEKEELWNEVRTQVDQGHALGVAGTPALFINGRELLSMHPVAIEALIRFELKGQGMTAAQLPADPDGIFP
jgi:uncharacterized membrane protein/protein-disulfide isomerase